MDPYVLIANYCVGAELFTSRARGRGNAELFRQVTGSI
jgi:hypothetical protein